MPSFSSDPITMPDEVGKDILNAGADLDAFFLPWSSNPVVALNKSPGTVISQSWPANTDVPAGTLIILDIASDGSNWPCRVVRRLGA